MKTCSLYEVTKKRGGERENRVKKSASAQYHHPPLFLVFSTHASNLFSQRLKGNTPRVAAGLRRIPVIGECVYKEEKGETKQRSR